MSSQDLNLKGNFLLSIKQKAIKGFLLNLVNTNHRTAILLIGSFKFDVKCNQERKNVSKYKNYINYGFTVKIDDSILLRLNSQEEVILLDKETSQCVVSKHIDFTELINEAKKRAFVIGKLDSSSEVSGSNIKCSPDRKKGLVGEINSKLNGNILEGFLFNIHDTMARTAILRIGNLILEINADMRGPAPKLYPEFKNHNFRVQISDQDLFALGEKFKVELLDKETGIVVHVSDIENSIIRDSRIDALRGFISEDIKNRDITGWLLSLLDPTPRLAEVKIEDRIFEVVADQKGSTPPNYPGFADHVFRVTLEDKDYLSFGDSIDVQLVDKSTGKVVSSARLKNSRKKAVYGLVGWCQTKTSTNILRGFVLHCEDMRHRNAIVTIGSKNYTVFCDKARGKTDNFPDYEDFGFELLLPEADFINFNHYERARLIDEETQYVLKEFTLQISKDKFISKLISKQGKKKQDMRLAGFLDTLERIITVSRMENAVAIVCWEGCHNPIGRAKVLEEILLAGNRPVLTFAFSMGIHGDSLWAPVADDPNMILIPWNEQSLYFSLLRLFSVSFNTIWICKNRYPSFVLAASLSNDVTTVVLDIDDYEESFYSDASHELVYGRKSLSVSNFITKGIAAKTAASVTLQEKFGGELCRHAREVQDLPLAEVDEKIIRICFIGTVRKHKGILWVCEKLQEFTVQSGKKIRFSVYGDIDSETYKKLGDYPFIHAEHKYITRNEVYEIIASNDVSITGGLSNSETAYYQISSKIGDALAVGVPVMVPFSESVRDLTNVEGVYVYGEDTFSSCLEKAYQRRQSGRIPFAPQFSHGFNYDVFRRQELAAGPMPLSKLLSCPRLASDGKAKTLVLLWKQNDASIYGRRVDQLARSYKHHDENCRVIVLELVTEQKIVELKQKLQHFSSENMHVYSSIGEKIGSGMVQDGVEYVTLDHSIEDLPEKFCRFLSRYGLKDDNTCFVLYPVINYLDRIFNVLKNYPIITDVVDNSFYFIRKNLSAMEQQYKSIFKASRINVFNSADNMKFFVNKFSLMQNKNVVIPNWYCSEKPGGNIPHEGKNILYSGNMNDRIDWELFRNVVGKFHDSVFHVAGVAAKSSQKLDELLKCRNVVYYGVVPESKMDFLLRMMDVGIMPHSVDECSNYMNPLKIFMYRHYGIPIVSTRVKGLKATPNLHICDSEEEFISVLDHLLSSLGQSNLALDETYDYPAMYMDIIDGLLNSGRTYVD